jgi:hypothetical protein
VRGHLREVVESDYFRPLVERADGVDGVRDVVPCAHNEVQELE